jgi:hypothetical protein
MLLMALGGIFLGGELSYLGTKANPSNQVLKEMGEQGYVLTSDATATAEDIVVGRSAYINGVLVQGTKQVLDTSDATATSDKIVKGKTAYVNGELVVGTLKIIPSQEITPTNSAVTVSGEGYIQGNIIIKGDKNLTADNIVNGIRIFNIAGKYVPGSGTGE